MIISQRKIILLSGFILFFSAGQLSLTAQITLAGLPNTAASVSGGLKAPEDSTEVRQVFQDFITSFDRLNWDKFISYFSDSATVFFFFENKPLRASGKNEIEGMFRKFFDEKRSTTAGPSYLQLKPEDVMIQMLSGAAVISFYINGKSGIGRRTIVFQKKGGKWVIIHLHASNISSGGK